MKTELQTTTLRPSILAGRVVAAGEAADDHARRCVFARYARRKTPQTIRRQKAALKLFALYLAETGLETDGEAMAADAAAWRGVTWGLIEGWIDWLLARSYAVGAINARLSTVKTYAGLAAQAGTIPAEQYALIRAVPGFSPKEARCVDETRRQSGQPTRQGPKKAAPRLLTQQQADRLKKQPATPQGRRDTLLMCLLLDHGLRCSEAARLAVDAFDLKAGKLRFFRQKVGKTQTHKLTHAAHHAARAYFDAGDAPAAGPVFRCSRRDGCLYEAGMSEQAITARVAALGRAVGVTGLSAHDCRHYAATYYARQGKGVKELMEIFGWNSPAMAVRYIADSQVICLEE